MIYDDLDYEKEAHIFANQQRYQNPLTAYDVFNADIEAGDDKSILIRDLVESYGLKIARKASLCKLSAVSCLMQIYNRHGHHTLDRTLRLTVSAWEGEKQSLSASMLRGISHLIVTFGDELKDDSFTERLGKISSIDVTRDAKIRDSGFISYAEVMMLNYNKGRQKSLPVMMLHNKEPPQALKTP